MLLFWSFAHLFFAFFFAGLNGFGTALFGTDSTVLSARVKRSAASGPSIISGWGFINSLFYAVIQQSGVVEFSEILGAKFCIHCLTCSRILRA